MNLNEVNKAQLRRTIYKDSFYEYFKYFWDTIEAHPLKEAAYIKYLCDKYQDILKGVADWKEQIKSYDLLINIAPGTTKSSIFSKIGPTYAWTLNPDILQIASSYAFEPVKEFTSKFTKILNSDEFKAIYPDISLTTDNVKKQENNSKGKRFATSTNGSIFGMHGDLITVDDHNKPPQIIRDENGNPKLAQGATLTEIISGNSWHDNSLISRKTDKELTRSIYVQQRLHRSDLSGYLLKKAEKGAVNLQHICLPAEIDMKIKKPQAFETTYENGVIVSIKDLKHLYSKAGLLDPERMSKEILEREKKVMGSYTFNAQYLQKPSRDKGGLIKARFFPVVEFNDLPTNLVKYFYTDPSEGKASSDNMATICWSLYESNIYVWEIMAEVKPFNEFIGHRNERGEWIDKTYDTFVKKHGITRQSVNFFEAKSSGTPYIQYINDQTPYNAVPDIPHGTKMDRVNISIGNWEAGRIKLVKNIPSVSSEWITDLLEEVANFTGKDGDPDDRVDVLTAMTKLTSLTGSSFILEEKESSSNPLVNYWGK